MSVRNVTPILNVSSVEASIAWFAKIGWREGFTWKDEGSTVVSFGSVRSGPGGGSPEIFLCLDGQGSRGTVMPARPGDDQTDGVWMSLWVDKPREVDAIHARALEQGLTVTHPPTDEPWGVREFHLRHPDGHMFRVGCGHGR